MHCANSYVHVKELFAKQQQFAEFLQSLHLTYSYGDF